MLIYIKTNTKLKHMNATDLLKVSQISRQNLGRKSEHIYQYMSINYNNSVTPNDNVELKVVEISNEERLTKDKKVVNNDTLVINKETTVANNTDNPKTEVNRSNPMNTKISHYQELSNQLANWIFSLSKEKIISATFKGHGWTNLFQYLPTNHPDNLAEIMPLLSLSKNYIWSGLPKKEKEDFLKYFAGIDKDSEFPIKSTKDNNGVPIILLMQGPKVGETRSLDCLRQQGLIPVMDQLLSKFKDDYPGVRLEHRWTGKNGYIIEAVWDTFNYKNQKCFKNLIRRKERERERE